jgi:hypothetical protein
VIALFKGLAGKFTFVGSGDPRLFQLKFLNLPLAMSDRIAALPLDIRLQHRKWTPTVPGIAATSDSERASARCLRALLFRDLPVFVQRPLAARALIIYLSNE